MAKILWIALSVNRGILTPFDALIAVARSMGHQVTPIEFTGTWDPDHVRQQIREASGFVLSSSDAIGQSELGTELRSQIEDGKHLAAFGTTMAANWLQSHASQMYRPMADYLRANFGLGGLPYKLVSTNGDRAFKLRTDEQFFFRGSPLATAVSEVTVKYPYLATYNQHSVPLLVCPDNSLAVDSHDDFVDIGRGPKAVAVSWPVSDEPGMGGVILFTAGLFSDELEGAPKTHPTRRLAENLISWLCGAEAAASSSPESARPDPVIVLRKIELEIHDIIRRVLARKHGADWRRSSLPESMRAEAAALRERLRGDGPLENYLYLIDLKKIIVSNWADFHTLLGVPGKSKEASMNWLDRLNGIRDRLYHPARLLETPLSREEIDFLHATAKMVTECLQSTG